MDKLGAMVLGMAFVRGAQAATVSYSFTTPENVAGTAYEGSLGLFDSSLGMLTGVTLELVGELSTEMSVKNNGRNTVKKSRMQTDVDLGFTSSLSVLNNLLHANGLDGAWLELSADTGVFSLAKGETRSFGPYSESGYELLDASSLAWAFSVAGGGNFGLSCFSAVDIMAMLGGNSQLNQITSAACGATITYTYEVAALPLPDLMDDQGGGVVARPVSEPPSLALVGLGVLMAAAGRRARTRRKAGA